MTDMSLPAPAVSSPLTRMARTPSIPLTRTDGPAAALVLLLTISIATGHVAVTPAGGALSALALFVTVVVVAFARRQLRADPRSASFVRLAIGLAAATVLLALANDALLIVAAWIASGRIMAGLIGHVGEWSEAKAARRSAGTAFLIGDMLLVGAALVLSLAAGTTQIGAIVKALPTMTPPIATIAAILLVGAAAVRCALPPFSTWLMRSLAAPTPVSALMHAGFVNAGGFLLIRLSPVIEAAPVARYALFAIGTFAALSGAVAMLARSDVKGAFAASTVAQMGFMLLTIALGAYAAALWHMVAHGLFKAWLFLGSAGAIATAGGRGKGLAQLWPAAIALFTIISAAMLHALGETTALLPVGLASAALLTALGVAIRSARRSRTSRLLVIVPIALIALNAVALALVGTVQHNAAVPLIPGYAQIGLLALFLAVWVYQQGLMRGERTLPPALHARLIHFASAA